MTTTRRFLINGADSTPRPAYSTLTEPQEVAPYLDGTPCEQGYPALEVFWEKITEADLQALLALFNPNSRTVTVQYWDKATQEDITRTAKMHRPVVGAHHFGYYDSVSVRFTRLTG